MILAVDPGKTGALAVLTLDAELHCVHDLPHADNRLAAPLFANHVRDVPVTCAVVEKVAARPGAGVSGMFNFGYGYGVIVGVLGALNIRTEHVTPTQWKKEMRLSADKDEARGRAIDRWPEHADCFKFKKNDGRAEACLLALWMIQSGRA